jgi:hypothetical protein
VQTEVIARPVRQPADLGDEVAVGHRLVVPKPPGTISTSHARCPTAGQVREDQAVGLDLAAGQAGHGDLGARQAAPGSGADR